jgi:hypothetical protein
MPRDWPPRFASARNRLTTAKQLDKGATWLLRPQPRPRSCPYAVKPGTWGAGDVSVTPAESVDACGNWPWASSSGKLPSKIAFAKWKRKGRGQ